LDFPLDDVSNELSFLDIIMPSYSDEFRRRVTSVSFPHLTHLFCHPEVLPIIHKCESLEMIGLYFDNDSLEEKDEVFKQLIECPFVERLQEIELQTVSMTTDQFERILFQVVPRFPNLEYLQFDSWRDPLREFVECHWLDVNSYLKAAADRIRSNDPSIRISTSLRKLSFPHEIGRTFLGMGEEERIALNTFLKTFSSIDCLFAGSYEIEWDNIVRLPPEFKYLLTTNMAGRRLLAEENGQNLGLWPVLLEAARKDRRIENRFPRLDEPPITNMYLEHLHPLWQLQDGIFGLLREFPEVIFASRLGDQFIQSSPSRKRPHREL